tara:strand:- start:488 stop:1363 length:876 start_codon:yes stop_codon:yes gene_type:complete
MATKRQSAPTPNWPKDRPGKYWAESIQARIDAASKVLEKLGYPYRPDEEKKAGQQGIQRYLERGADRPPLTKDQRLAVFAYNHLKDMERILDDVLAGKSENLWRALTVLLEWLPDIQSEGRQLWDQYERLLATQEHGKKGGQTTLRGYAIEKATRQFIEEDHFTTLTSRSARACFDLFRRDNSEQPLEIELQKKDPELTTKGAFPEDLVGEVFTLTVDVQDVVNPEEYITVDSPDGPRKRPNPNTMLVERKIGDEDGQPLAIKYPTFRDKYYKPVWRALQNFRNLNQAQEP